MVAPRDRGSGSLWSAVGVVYKQGSGPEDRKYQYRTTTVTYDCAKIHTNCCSLVIIVTVAEKGTGFARLRSQPTFRDLALRAIYCNTVRVNRWQVSLRGAKMSWENSKRLLLVCTTSSCRVQVAEHNRLLTFINSPDSSKDKVPVEANPDE